MDIIRPRNFEEIKGNERTIKRIRDRTIEESLSKLILICGAPGIGKTSTAYVVAKARHCACEDRTKIPCGKCRSCMEIDDMILGKEESTTNIKLFSMPSEKAGDTVKAVISELNTDFVMDNKKTVIVDELQNLADAQQRDFLKPFESIPDGVQVILCTTDYNMIIEALRSRCVVYRLKTLSKTDLKWVLKKELLRRHLQIEQEDRALEFIMDWADYRARDALKCLEGLGKSRVIDLDEILDMIDYIPVKEIIPIITSFKGSYIKGIKTIESMNFDDVAFKSLKLILIDILKIANIDAPRHISMSEIALVKEALQNVSTDTILQFVYNVLAIQKFDSTSLLVAYLKAHPSLNKLEKNNKEQIVSEEASVNSMRVENKITKQVGRKHSSMEALIRKGAIVNRK